MMSCFAADLGLSIIFCTPKLCRTAGNLSASAWRPTLIALGPNGSRHPRCSQWLRDTAAQPSLWHARSMICMPKPPLPASSTLRKPGLHGACRRTNLISGVKQSTNSALGTAKQPMPSLKLAIGPDQRRQGLGSLSIARPREGDRRVGLDDYLTQSVQPVHVFACKSLRLNRSVEATVAASRIPRFQERCHPFDPSPGA